MGKRRLTERQRTLLKADIKRGVPQRKLASKYNVNKTTVEYYAAKVKEEEVRPPSILSVSKRLKLQQIESYARHLCDSIMTNIEEIENDPDAYLPDQEIFIKRMALKSMMEVYNTLLYAEEQEEDGGTALTLEIIGALVDLLADDPEKSRKANELLNAALEAQEGVFARPDGT